MSAAFWKGFWRGLAQPVLILAAVFVFVAAPFGGTAARFGAWIKTRF